MNTALRNTSKNIISQLSNPQFWIWAIALVIVAFSLSNHEPWVDEAEAPDRIYRAAGSLTALLNSFKGDGHFPLYHLLLLPFFNAGQALGFEAFVPVKFFTFIQYVIFATLVCRWVRFPFSGLLLFSYYPLYEYGTISRCYLLAMIFFLIMVRSLTSEDINPVVRAIAYFCFPLTQVLSMIFALPLGAYLLLKRKWLEVGALTASFIICLYYLSIRDTEDPFSQFLYLLQDDTRTLPAYVVGFFRFTLAAWFPFSTQDVWWNQSFVSQLSLPTFILLFIFVIFTLICIFVKRPLLISALSIGSIAAISVLVYKYPTGSFRHLGYITWTFLCCFGLMLFNQPRSHSSEITPDRTPEPVSRKSWLLNASRYGAIALLVFNVFAGAAAVYKDSYQLFDSSELRLAEIQKLKESQNLPIFAYPCWSFWPIAVLSTWEYNNYSLWNPDTYGCAAPVADLKLPPAFIFQGWSVYSDLEAPLPIPELDGVTLKQFFQANERTCEEVLAAPNVQVQPSSLYVCRA